MAIARLTVAGIAHRLELDLEQSDDLKLAVTEACGFLLERVPDSEPINLSFVLEDDHVFRVTVCVGPNAEGTDDLAINDQDNLGLFLIHALMDGVKASNQGRTLVMSKDLSRRVDE